MGALLSSTDTPQTQNNVWKPPTIFDIPATTLQQMILFLVYDEPLPMLKMKLINKYFYKIFSIDFGGTNFIWKVIVFNKFKNVSPKYTTKRWDKLYQLRIEAMKRTFNSFAYYNTNVSKIQEIEDIMIEGCDLGLPQSKKLGKITKLKLKSGLKKKKTVLDGLKFKEIIVENSLMDNGYIWFIQCPILQNKENRRFRNATEYDNDGYDQINDDNGLIISNNKYKSINYCTVCAKHVYNVDNEYDFKEYMDNGACVSMSGKLIEDQTRKNDDAVAGCILM